tara:strand:+ start:450 stop:656 length:207 start_codon:yes stop_codon:yes gene_type:complete
MKENGKIKLDMTPALMYNYIMSGEDPGRYGTTSIDPLTHPTTNIDANKKNNISEKYQPNTKGLLLIII